MLYFRLGVATVVWKDSSGSCHLRRSKCCVSTVAAVTETKASFSEGISFDHSAVSTRAKLSLSLCRAEGKSRGVMLNINIFCLLLSTA